MATYKSKHTGKRVDEAVDKIPENLPSEDSLIVIKADGSSSDYLSYSQVAGDKLDKQTAQTETDQIYGKLADGSQTMFNTTMGAESTTIPRRDTAGRIQVADGVSGTDAVNFQQFDAKVETKLNKPTITGSDYKIVTYNGTNSGTLDYSNAPNASSVMQRDADGRSQVADGIAGKDIVNYSQLDKKYDKSGGTIGGDVVITGDLTVNGTEHINNTENLAVKNAMIYSNSDGATLAQLGGLGIKTNATDIYGIVYDPVSDSVKLGLGKSDADGKFTFNTNEGEPVAVRDDSSKLTNGNLIKWDSANHKLVDSGKNVDDFSSATNIENGTGTSSIRQPADPKYDGVIKAATKNPYAKVLYPDLTDSEPIGAVGDYAASFGGNSSVQAKRGIGGGTSSVTKGAYSQSLGDNTVTTPNASDSTAIGYQTTTDAPAAFTHGAYTVVMSQKYVEGMFDPNAEPGQPGQPTEPGTTPADTLEMDKRRGEAASAGGFNCYSSGFAAEVDGVSNVADGHISKSSGRSNRSWSYLSKTDGKNSVVKPDETDTDATGEGSWANGDTVQIIGAKYAYAGGSYTVASKGANYSFSHGLGLYASNDAQAVFGQYNVGDDVSQFIVGVGTSDTSRKTAFQVLKDGQVLANTAPTNPNAVIRKQEFDAEHLRTWFTINDTNTNLNRVNEESYKKVGGQISGNVYITGTLTVVGKTQVKTAPTENNDVLRYQDIAIEVETSLMGA